MFKFMFLKSNNGKDSL